MRIMGISAPRLHLSTARCSPLRGATDFSFDGRNGQAYRGEPALIRKGRAIHGWRCAVRRRLTPPDTSLVVAVPPASGRYVGEVDEAGPLFPKALQREDH
jgi:hypothetical protein